MLNLSNIKLKNNYISLRRKWYIHIKLQALENVEIQSPCPTSYYFEKIILIKKKKKKTKTKQVNKLFGEQCRFKIKAEYYYNSNNIRKTYNFLLRLWDIKQDILLDKNRICPQTMKLGFFLTILCNNPLWHHCSRFEEWYQQRVQANFWYIHTKQKGRLMNNMLTYKIQSAFVTLELVFHRHQ